MRISTNWLKEYVDFDLTPEQLADRLTMLGLEVESIERPGEGITGVVTGKILSIQRHPDADKLVVCKTDVGRSEPLQIVCGARNMSEGDIVPTATVGATLPGGFAIGRRKMRGIESQGMMCSAQELGLGEDHSGLMILDPATEIGLDAVSLLGLDDAFIEIEVTPNRGDWASMIGVARELAALLGTPFRVPEVSLTESDRSAADLASITIEAPDLCPRYIGRVLTDIRIGPSPDWLARRLIAGGVRPINNIVDVTNYVLLETGHPLHAFDYDRLDENRIVVRRARAGETLKTLDEQDRPLTPDMLVIADAKNPVAIAGIMGGHESEVGEGTTTILLESAYFDPRSIRKTARALAMITEASARFQRGADPDMAEYAVNRAAQLMAEIAGAQVAEGLLDEYPGRWEPAQVTLRYARADALLGVAVAPDRQRAFLTSLGLEIAAYDDTACAVLVPRRRNDVSHEADLIEEIARLYGYDQIPSTLPRVRRNQQSFAPAEAVLRHTRQLLAAQGLDEFVSMTFSSPQEISRLALDDPGHAMVTLQNPLSENQSTMRSTLLPGMLAAVSRNLRRGVTRVQAFEVGSVYHPAPNQELPNESLSLAIALTGHRAPSHWDSATQLVDIYDLKGYLENLLNTFTSDYAFEPHPHPVLNPNASATILVNGGPLGCLGTVSQNALHNYDIRQPVHLLELDLQTLADAGLIPTPSFTPVPAFPPSLRDMAVLVDSSVPVGNLCAAAKQAGGQHLLTVDIFDIYTGEQVPAGKKSVALSFVFQSHEKTLTDKETQKSWDRILAALQRHYQAELR